MSDAGGSRMPWKITKQCQRQHVWYFITPQPRLLVEFSKCRSKKIWHPCNMAVKSAFLSDVPRLHWISFARLFFIALGHAQNCNYSAKQPWVNRRRLRPGTFIMNGNWGAFVVRLSQTVHLTCCRNFVWFRCALSQQPLAGWQPTKTFDTFETRGYVFWWCHLLTNMAIHHIYIYISHVSKKTMSISRPNSKLLEWSHHFFSLETNPTKTTKNLVSINNFRVNLSAGPSLRAGRSGGDWCATRSAGNRFCFLGTERNIIMNGANEWNWFWEIYGSRTQKPSRCTSDFRCAVHAIQSWDLIFCATEVHFFHHFNANRTRKGLWWDNRLAQHPRGQGQRTWPTGSCCGSPRRRTGWTGSLQRRGSTDGVHKLSRREV